MGARLNGYLLPRVELVKMFGADVIRAAEKHQVDMFQKFLDDGAPLEAAE